MVRKGIFEMQERPILLNGEMVRATLDDRKTKTRRVIKPQEEMTHEGRYHFCSYECYGKCIGF
jgi:hypothetical protein